MNDRFEIFKNSIHILQAKEPYELTTKDNISTLTSCFVAKVESEQNKVIANAILEAVKNGKIHTGILISAEKLQEFFDSFNPVPVVDSRCIKCGAELYPHFNKKYCGNCGQRIDWDVTQSTLLTRLFADSKEI